MSAWMVIGRQTMQPRMAMRTHGCGRCPAVIRPGDMHLVVTYLPTDLVTRPQQGRECRRCVLSNKPRLAEWFEDGPETTRAVVERLAGEWADDLSFASPAELADQLLKALDGAA